MDCLESAISLRKKGEGVMRRLIVFAIIILTIPTWVDSTEAVVYAEDASPQAVWRNCDINAIAVWDLRIHVHCVPIGDPIEYFAVPTSDAQNAARFLSLFSGAFLADKQLSIRYDPDDTTSGPPIGCIEADCRIALSASIF